MPSLCLRVCLLLTILISLPCITDAKTLVVSHPNLPTHPMGRGFKVFKEELEKRSGGNFTVLIYDNSSYGTFEEVMLGLDIGVVQIGTHSTSNFSVYNPDFMLFDFPFFISSYDEGEAITDSEIGKALATGVQRRVYGLGYLEIGFRNIFSTRPIRTLEDAKDLKIRTTASAVQNTALKSLGMAPVEIAWENVYESMKNGQSDAIDIDIDLNSAYYSKIPRLAKYVTLTRGAYIPHIVFVSQLFWDKLTPQEKEWIEDSFKIMQDYQRTTNRKDELVIIEEIKEAGGEVIELTPEEKQRWMDVSKQEIKEQFDDKISENILKSAVEVLDLE